MSEFGEIIETTTIDEPPVEWLGIKTQILIGLLLAGLVFWKITTTGAAFVDAPKWSIFDSPVTNAIFSGLVGIVENLIFFAIIPPTAFAICMLYSENPWMSFMVMLVVGMSVFTTYHSWRYGYDEMALLSVASFAMINIVIVHFTKSIIISDIIHFTNNFALGAGYATRVALSVVF